MSHPKSLLETLRPQLVSGGDRKYFEFHARRFERHLATLLEAAPRGARVLDIGSHYLHLSSAMSLAGFNVTALDVAEFQQLDFVRRRAEAHRVRTETINDLGKAMFLEDAASDAFDVVLFSEILEHITFNPVAFWRRVYDLLKAGGFVYLSTPNSLRLSNSLKTAFRLVARRGVGIPVDEIFGHVTYGHHWKEYSARELREYFARLSPDFQLDIRFVDYGLANAGIAGPITALGGIVPALRPHIEAVIRLPAKGRWNAQPRRYDE